VIKSLDFLYYKYPCQGQVNSETILFNASLQNFTQQVDYLCSLETEGELSSQQTYKQIKLALEELELNKKKLDIDQHLFQNKQATLGI
jgi:hypothetical protein